MSHCPFCNREIAKEARFCDGCGAELSVSLEGNPEKHPKKTGKKWLLCIGAVVLVVAVFVTSAFFWMNGEDLIGKADDEESVQDVLFYIKDDELYLADPAKKDGIVPLSTDFLRYEYEDFLYDDFGLYLESSFYIGKNGLTIYYDKLNEEDGSALYYRYVGKTTTEPIKIDSAVREYIVNPAETMITYITGDTDSVYQYDLETNNKDKIGSDIWKVALSEDGEKVFLQDDNGDSYVKKNGEEKQKIISDANLGVYFNDDMTTFYYVKDDALYKQTEGEERVKIDTDVRYILRTYETGEIYYVGVGDDNFLWDYVTDDLKEQDSKPFDLEEPVPDYEREQKAKTEAERQRINEEYWEAVDEYNEAWRFYSGRSERNELRQELKDCTVGLNDKLCYYDGTNTTVIAEGYCNTSWTSSAEHPIRSFEVYDLSRVDKILFSEFAASYEYDKVNRLQSRVVEQLYSETKSCLAVGETVTTQEDGTLYWINDLSTEIYYLEKEDPEDLVGELYRVTVTDGEASAPVFVDSDVSVDGCGFWWSEHFVYFKDVNRTKDKGDLYIDQVKIDSEVSTTRITFVEETGAILYYTDYDTDAKCGTLKMRQDGEAVKIADDIYDYTVLSKGRIAYLYDYSTKHQKGELRLWQDGESRSLDIDVNCLINYSHYHYRYIDF